MHILSIDRYKIPLQISGKVAGCVVRRTLKTFQGTHILGASRGLLCDSSAVLLIVILKIPACRKLLETSPQDPAGGLLFGSLGFALPRTHH